MSADRPPIVHPDAVALSAFRELPGGRAREYSASWTPGDPWRGVEWMVRTGWFVGFIAREPMQHSYACLDVLAENGDVLDTYDIPDARAFRWFYRMLHLRVVGEDGR